MTNRTRTLLPWLFLLAIAGCRSEGDGAAVAELRAESRLAAATAEAADPAGPGPEVTLRRVSTGSDYDGFRNSFISPHGRYVSLTDFSTLELAVRDLSTGQLHRLTNAHDEEGMALRGVFSPDGRHIVYAWAHGPGLQLRVIGFEPDEAGVPRAAEPTIIFHNAELLPIPFDESPDGRHILANIETPGNTNQLALISTTTGAHQALKSFDWRRPLRAEFSPDGRYVAYDLPPEIGSRDRDLFVLSVDGTYEARIVDDPASDRLLGWHPDGSILFGSDRGGTPGLWRLAMAEGRPTGAAELVKADMWGVEPLGFADGSFYYGVNVNPVRLYTAAVDFAAGRLAGAPVPVDDPSRIGIRAWDWSPDGKFLAYYGSTAGTDGSVIVIRSERGEEVQTFHLDVQLAVPGRIRWAADGKSLIVFVLDGIGRYGFRRVDLETGSHTTILRPDLEGGSVGGPLDISPDGRTIWFSMNRRDDLGWTLIAYDTESGASRSITPVEWDVRDEVFEWTNTRVAISPDGAELALVVPDTVPTATDARAGRGVVVGHRWILGTMPIGGGPFTPLAHVGEHSLIHGLEWTADGRSIVFSTDRIDSRPEGEWTTWIVPADGGEARPLELMEHLDPRGMKLHPDGRRIAFLAGESREEVWVIEGLGAPASTAAETEDFR